MCRNYVYYSELYNIFKNLRQYYIDDLTISTGIALRYESLLGIMPPIYSIILKFLIMTRKSIDALDDPNIYNTAIKKLEMINEKCLFLQFFVLKYYITTNQYISLMQLLNKLEMIFLSKENYIRLIDLYNYYFKFSATAQRTLELLYRNQAEFRGIGIAVILVCITLIFYLFYYIKNKDEQTNTSADPIFFNGVLIWGILKIAMLYSGYATRFASYFSFYIYLFLPYVLKKVNIKEKNKKAIALIIASLCLWAFLTASKAYGSYYSIFM